jgi:hypothetical protein
MNIIQRFKAKTPERNRKAGVFTTKLATAFAGILATGLVTNKYAIIIMIGFTFAFGTHAVVNGLKVEKPIK